MVACENQMFFVINGLDDAVADDRLMNEYYRIRGEFCGGIVALQLFWEWFESRPGYDVRFLRTFRTVKDKHDSHMREMADFEKFLRSCVK